MTFSEKRNFLLIFVVLSTIFLLHTKIVGSAVWGDARYYYSHLRSLVIDGNLDYANEAKYFSFEANKTQTGSVANKFSIGPALLWLPFYILTHLVILTIKLLYPNVNSDGYGMFYQNIIGLSSVFYGCLGLYFLYKTLNNYFSNKISLISTITLLFTSNLIFYLSIDPLNSHSLSFFSASALLFFTQQLYKKKKPKPVFLSGIFLGFLILIRNQDAIFALIPITILIHLFKNNWTKLLKHAIVLLIPVILILLPQFYVWHILFGVIKSPYLLLGEKFYWLNPKLLQTLFSQNNGLIYYTPIVLLCLAGLYYLFKKNKLFSMLGLLLFVLQLYIVASWHTWWAGASYSNRMFVSNLPLLSLGLASLIEKHQLKINLVFLIGFILSCLNSLQIIKLLLKT
jgi:hypothetical protein